MVLQAETQSTYKLYNQANVSSMHLSFDLSC